MMFPPTDRELAQARQLGIDSAGLSGPALRGRMAAVWRQRRAPTQVAKLTEDEEREQKRGEHRQLLSICRALGVSTPSGATSPELERLYKARLPGFLADRGVVEGAVIYMPEGIVSMHGRAVVGPLHLDSHQVAIITLYFDSAGRGFCFNAYRVAVHAVANKI